MEYLKAFTAGFISTLLFHQGMLGVLYALGISPKKPFDMTATAPLKIPAVLSLAFWGGLWGVALWMVIRGLPDCYYWGLALAFGAIWPSVVALFIVFPLKKMPIAGGWDPKIISGALILNGAWGLGVALLMQLMETL